MAIRCKIRRALGGLAAVFAMPLAGCAAPPSHTASLSQGFSAYTQRQYAQASQVARAYIAGNPNGTQLDYAYYLLGIANESRGRFTLAHGEFLRSIALTHRDSVRRKAYKALGDMAYTRTHYNTAATYYQSALSAMDGRTPPAPLLFRLGASLQDAGHWGQARQPLSEAISFAPGTPAAQNASQRLAATHFSLQYGAFLVNGSAWAMVGQMRTTQLSAMVVPAVVAGRTLYLVQSGNFSTLSAAMAARSAVSRTYPQVIVVP